MLSLADLENDCISPECCSQIIAQTAMDESYSIQLPTVSSPTSAIETLLTSFTGEVIKVDNPDEVQTLNLDPSKSYMIVVNLPPVTKHDEYGSFQASGTNVK